MRSEPLVRFGVETPFFLEDQDEDAVRFRELRQVGQGGLDRRPRVVSADESPRDRTQEHLDPQVLLRIPFRAADVADLGQDADPGGSRTGQRVEGQEMFALGPVEIGDQDLPHEGPRRVGFAGDRQDLLEHQVDERRAPRRLPAGEQDDKGRVDPLEQPGFVQYERR